MPRIMKQIAPTLLITLSLLTAVLSESPAFPAAPIAGATREATSALELSPVEDFRRVSWGASEAEVRQSETHPPVTREEGPLLLLAYSGRLLGRPCRIVYRFLDDRLAVGYYLLEGDGLPGDFLARFERCRAELSRHYGPATRDQVLWREIAPNTPRLSLEEALWGGEAQCLAVWERPPTLMTLSLRSVDGPANLKLILLYESLLLGPVVEQAQKQARDASDSATMR